MLQSLNVERRRQCGDLKSLFFRYLGKKLGLTINLKRTPGRLFVCSLCVDPGFNILITLSIFTKICMGIILLQETPRPLLQFPIICNNSMEKPQILGSWSGSSNTR